MSDWVLTQIDEYDFWSLIHELIDDNSGFIHNKTILLKAYKTGNLYGLRSKDMDQDSIYCHDSYYLLPCLCVKDENKAIIIWTHTRARNNGLAKKLVELLEIKYAVNPLESSLGFWEKCNCILIND